MVYRLDVKDKQILYELDMQGRRSYSQIARKIGLSKEVVDYRIKKLQKEYIIKGYYSIIDVFKIGLLYTKYFIKFSGIPNKVREGFKRYCLDSPYVGWYITAEGHWDVNIIIYGRSLEHIKALLADINNRFGTYFGETTFLITTKFTNFRRDILFDTKTRDYFYIKDSVKREEIDDLDRSILAALSVDSRTPLVEIARSTGKTINTIISRIKALEEKKILLVSRLRLNETKLGYLHYKFLFYFVSQTASSYNSFVNMLKQDIRTYYIIENIGDCILDVNMIFKDLDDYVSFIENMKKRFSHILRNYKSALHYSFDKVNYFPG